MDIRVECPCGQAYQFPVEPVNDLMPCPVACPACGTDGTALANQFIRSSAATPAIPIPPPVTASSGLRINRPTPAATATETSAPAAQPISAPRTYQLPTPAPKPVVKANIPLGILGGLISGSLAMFGWYLLTIATNHEFGIIASVVGVITGVGVRWLGKDGSPAMAYIAAIFAALAILGGDFLVVNHVVNDVAGNLNDVAVAQYDSEIASAKEGLKLQTDAEIKNWLEKNDEVAVANAQDIENFRKVEQPKMQDLLNGKPSKTEYLQKFNAPLASFGTRFTIFKESLQLFTILWLIFGVISAWRIAYK